MSTVLMTAEQINEKYISLRNRKKEIEARHKAELKPLVDVMEQLEVLTLQFLQANAMKSISTEGGTCFIVTRRSYKITDRDDFRSWCEANGRTDFLEARPAKSAIDEYLEAGNSLPPGLDTSADVAVQFRAK